MNDHHTTFKPRKPYRLLVASLLFVSAAAAQSNELKPIQAQSIDLLGIRGTAYYTVREDGFHLVATLVLSEALEPPLRIQAVLRHGQTVSFSTPGAVNCPAVTLEFTRKDDQLLVSDRSATD